VININAQPLLQILSQCIHIGKSKVQVQWLMFKLDAQALRLKLNFQLQCPTYTTSSIPILSSCPTINLNFVNTVQGFNDPDSQP
jgi:hypothetical protein